MLYIQKTQKEIKLVLMLDNIFHEYKTEFLKFYDEVVLIDMNESKSQKMQILQHGVDEK